ncbi:MAG: carboxypeptidase-like regulatory domain-containing protein [Candidatus ainarchaeum sp.]|nr:carboxypeptidase-like regulatory domain-containing protein [Candidatus ainarchaeum sp.]
MSIAKNFLILLSFLLICGIAFATPGIPHQFYGTVTINGTPANNANIVAKINNLVVASTVSTNGGYGFYPNIFYVPDPNNTNNGKTIEFFLNGNEVATYIFENGASTQLDLFYGAAPFCGDSQCNASETCTSCQADCGTCPPVIPPNGGTGGGTGGGSGGTGGEGGGSAGGNLIVQIIGNCVSKPLSVGVVNINGNPVANAEIEVVHNRNSIAKTNANADGNASFTFEEIGKYEFVARSGIAVSSLKIITLEECGTESPPEQPATNETTDLCKNKDCNDKNPCTQDTCNKGFCNYTSLEEISCGTNMACKSGECVLQAEPETAKTGTVATTGFFGLETGTGNIIIGILLTVAVAWLGLAYKFRLRKK